MTKKDEYFIRIIEDLKKHLFELSFALDSQSAGKDFIALRKTHYDNVTWLHDNGLQEEYYQYFSNKINKVDNV